MIDQLTRQLRGDEGVRRTIYQDHLGYWTIGVGRLVDPSKPGSGLRSSEIDFLLRNDIDDRMQELTRRLPWFSGLDEARQAVLVNMAFQLGTEGLMGFRTTLSLIESGMYSAASVQMLRSKWATQTPERAARLAEQMKTGRWQFAADT